MVLFDGTDRETIDFRRRFPNGRVTLRTWMGRGLLLSLSQWKTLFEHYSIAEHFAVPFPEAQTGAIACLTVSARENFRPSVEDQSEIVNEVNNRLDVFAWEIYQALKPEFA